MRGGEIRRDFSSFGALILVDITAKSGKNHIKEWCFAAFLCQFIALDVAAGLLRMTAAVADPTADESGNLAKVVERTKIEKYEGGIHFTEDGETWEDLPADTLVSMNLWGFTPGFLQALAEGFPAFLKNEMPQNPAKKEYLLPTIVSQLLEEGKATVKVLSSADKWYGVTYAADKPTVVAALKEKTEQGLYPNGLWKK